MECPQQQVKNLARSSVSFENEVKSGQAAHRSPVDDFVLPVWVIAEEGGDDVFQRMHGSHIDSRFSVGPCEPDVVGGDFVGTDRVYPAGKNAGDNGGMIDGKARYQVHILSPFFHLGDCESGRIA